MPRNQSGVRSPCGEDESNLFSIFSCMEKWIAQLLNWTCNFSHMWHMVAGDQVWPCFWKAFFGMLQMVCEDLFYGGECGIKLILISWGRHTVTWHILLNLLFSVFIHCRFWGFFWPSPASLGLNSSIFSRKLCSNVEFLENDKFGFLSKIPREKIQFEKRESLVLKVRFAMLKFWSITQSTIP